MAVSPFELSVDGGYVVIQDQYNVMPHTVSTGASCHGSGPSRSYLECDGLFTFYAGQTAIGTWSESRTGSWWWDNGGTLVVNVFGFRRDG
jgi:hypothetical protein